MTTDKTPATLATVKHGGCVQLRHHDLSTSEGGRRFIAEYFTRELHRHDFTNYITTRLAADFACALAQHLSAQPSPGGQDALSAQAVGMLPDDARLVGVIADNIERDKLDHPGFYRNTQLAEVLRRVLSAALAARQPVEFERAIPTRRRESAVELLLELGFVWNNQRWEDRRQPVGVPVVWVSPGQLAAHKDRGAGQGGNYLPTRLTRDGEFTRPLYDAPAQAVDLGAAIKAAFPRLTDYGLHHSHCCEYKLIDERNRLHVLIDSQAVGNG
ncbi:hypothetical protein D3C81_665720 [compost metagenome]